MITNNHQMLDFSKTQLENSKFVHDKPNVGFVLHFTEFWNYSHEKLDSREGTRRNHYLFLLGRLPLEIDGRLLSTTLTSTWAVVLFSTPARAQEHTHTCSELCTSSRTNHAPGEICPPTSQSDALITSYP